MGGVIDFISPPGTAETDSSWILAREIRMNVERLLSSLS